MMLRKKKKTKNSLKKIPYWEEYEEGLSRAFPGWSLGFSRQEHWSGLPCPPPMHESEM